MNKQRAAAIRKCGEDLGEMLNTLQELLTEEEEYFDAMPESLQGGEQGERSQEAQDALCDAVSQLEDVAASLESIY
jgi:hypothetical protein